MILAATLASADHTREHPVMPQHHTLSCAGSLALSKSELPHDTMRMVAVRNDFEATMQSLLQEHVYSYHFPQHKKSKLSIYLHEPPFTSFCSPSPVILPYSRIIYHKSSPFSQIWLLLQIFRDPGIDNSASLCYSSCYMWLLLLYGTARTIVKPYRSPLSALMTVPLCWCWLWFGHSLVISLSLRIHATIETEHPASQRFISNTIWFFLGSLFSIWSQPWWLLSATSA